MEDMKQIIVITVIVIFLLLFISAAKAAKKKEQQELFDAMPLDERSNIIFGEINPHLVCPHCQTKEKVRAKSLRREIVSTGTVGGILKTNTENTIEKIVTQHHCDHCGSTWDI